MAQIPPKPREPPYDLLCERCLRSGRDQVYHSYGIDVKSADEKISSYCFTHFVLSKHPGCWFRVYCAVIPSEEADRTRVTEFQRGCCERCHKSLRGHDWWIHIREIDAFCCKKCFLPKLYSGIGHRNPYSFDFTTQYTSDIQSSWSPSH